MGYALQKETLENNCETIIVGLGETGLSVAAYLDARNISFAVMDTRSEPPLLNTFKQKYPNISIDLGEIALNKLHNAKQIILSPGIDIKSEIIQTAINAGANCYGDIEIFARATQVPIVAITGSNGKSTVTSLVAEMAKTSGLRAYPGGNLGPPALDLLNSNNAELFVLELSSFQLESTKSLTPKVAAVLNISADHLDRHGDVQSYANIKAAVFNQAKNSVINRDDVFVTSMNTSGAVSSFGLGSPTNEDFGLIHGSGDVFLAKGKNCLLSTNEISMPGESGILNSLAALAIGDALGLPLKKMLIALTTFKGLPHRFSLVGTSNGVSWFNDSKGTNIGAAISSLRGLQDNVVLIAGGVFKGGDLSLLRDAVAKHAKHVILFGHDASMLDQALNGATSIHHVKTMHEAVRTAHDLVNAGDNVLLSPACASFDMYENYIERGEDFESCVKEFAL